MTKSESILKLMIKAAEKSAEIIRNNFRQNSSYQEKKSHIDIVTQTDFKSQKKIHDLLVKGMRNLGIKTSEVGFIEEESTDDSVKHHTFIIDPLDGTTNFAAGFPFCCVSIGYAVDQEIKIGVALEIFSKTLYWGEKGNGSFVKNELLGKRGLKQQTKAINSWLVSSHLNALDVVNEQFADYRKIYPHVRGMRNTGSLVLDLCLLADSVFDLVLNIGGKIWDLAAARVILEEAGGKIYDYQGQDLQFNWFDTKKQYRMIACHPSVQKDVLSLLDKKNS